MSAGIAYNTSPPFRITCGTSGRAIDARASVMVGGVVGGTDAQPFGVWMSGGGYGSWAGGSGVCSTAK